MFQKPAFGSNTSGFGSFNATATASSPFGGFKPTTGASSFGAAPAFGTTGTPQQAAGGGLFGSTGTTSGLFGTPSTSTAAPAFGAAGSSFGLGSSPAGGGGLFGSTATPGTGLFGATQPQQTGAFGAKPTGFGFGNTTASGTTGGGLFGGTTTGGGLFGQQNTSMSGGGGLFGGTAGAFGQQQQPTGTAHAKYNPVLSSEVLVKGGNSQTVNVKHHVITCMKEYEGKSLEELRLEDYLAGRKGNANAGMFGGFQAPSENKPLFGGTSFGQPATTGATSVFGGGLGTGGFGQANTFSFGGGTAQNANTGNLFGASKPAFGATSTAGGGLFGSGTTQPAPAFGTPTSTFSFGGTAQNQTSNLFGAKPATSGFGTAPAATTGFGGFGTGTSGLFGAKPASTAAPAFGTTTPAFGTLSGGFGTNTSAAGGLFGGTNAFGAKPAQPAFGFGTGQQAGGIGGLGGGLGASSFQQKPGGSVFPAFNAPGASGGMFSGAGQLQQQPLSFGTGNATLGGGLNTSLGGFGAGGASLGGGMGAFGNAALQRNNLSGASAGGNVHEQILALAARPYGDSPLYKDISPSSASEDMLRPTNPAAIKAVLDRTNYRVGSPDTPRLRVLPHANKKSLFDGLEEADSSLEDKLSLKPSRKRLVLRPQQNGTDTSGHAVENHNRSSLEDVQKDLEGSSRNRTSDSYKENIREKVPGDQDREQQTRQRSEVDGNLRGVNTDLEDSSERHGSWLGSSRLSWNETKDRQAPEQESSNRLYPDLDAVTSDSKRSSSAWLRRKQSDYPWPKNAGNAEPRSNSEAAESSVRELRIEPRISLIESTISNTEEVTADVIERLHYCEHRSAYLLAGCSCCLMIANQIRGMYVPEEDSVPATDAPPHPAGVKLTRAGYYTVPSLEDMIGYIRSDGSCVVPNLTIGRRNYGSVYYDCEIDVAGLDLDYLVHFLNKEVIVYPADADKPPVGQGLNRRAIVTLDMVWPRDKTEKRPITDPDRLLKMDYEGKLRRVCDKHDTKFIEYRPQTGSWVFRVEHFSKYGLTDSDEEDEPVPEVLQRQLVKQPLQQASAPVLKPPIASTAQPTLVPAPTSLGGLSMLVASEDPMLAMQQTSVNLLGELGRGVFEMDTTEDNGESQTLYPDVIRSFGSGSGVKSPTSELARLEHRRSHNVQLMKASLYADAEMDEDAPGSTGDQLVPQPPSVLSFATRAPSTVTATTPTEDYGDDAHAAAHGEISLRPLDVRPHTIVLRYHRKVPPFQQTIAGRLQAASIADLSVARARHSRIGFGPGGALVYVTTRDSFADLPPVAELCELQRYVRGRGRDDWSEQAVARLAICGRGGAGSTKYKDALAGHLAVLLEHSDVVAAGADRGCPRLAVGDEPETRLAALRAHVAVAKALADDTAPSFGVSGSYCYEVWRLCDALWGSDLENDGVASGDTEATVHRYRQVVEWLTGAVASETDAELSRPRPAEAEDDTDSHSARVLTLLIGGRVAEACRAARDAGDINMATLIAQAGGDPTLRSLVARQLSLWRECGADSLITPPRLLALRLLAGSATPADLLSLDWLRAFNVHARYLCAQVPTVAQIVASYEGSFYACEAEDARALSERDDDVDLSVVREGRRRTGMPYPVPPYASREDVDETEENSRRRVLDLRFELLRARATDSRPRLHTACYTADPLDYSLSFLLGAWFGCGGAESVVGLAQQLEAAGEWHLAVQALMYHPNDAARAHLVQETLSRHAPAAADTDELRGRVRFLSERLHVPDQWIHIAQAHRAKYEHLPALEAEHLSEAGCWNAAHRVLLEELLPETVLADELDSITPLLERMNAAARQHEISGWEAGGQALYHYVHVCNEIRELVSAGEQQQQPSEQLQAHLEALRPRVAAACRALGGIEPTGVRQTAARAELGSRLLQLALAAGERPRRVAALLRALKLPPDCAASAHRKITTELATEASECCIESSPNSPVSSRRNLAARI